MASLSLSQDIRTGGPYRWFSSVRDRVVTFAEITGAAIRVARAAESRHAANPADLKLLGINAPLPKAW